MVNGDNMLSIFKTTNKYQAGFTLVELLIVIAIVAILAAMGGASLNNVIKNSLANKIRNELYSSLVLAQFSANNTNERVAVCPTNNVVAPACDGSWANFAREHRLIIKAGLSTLIAMIIMSLIIQILFCELVHLMPVGE